MTVGERIKILCKLKGITVKQLEQDLGYGNGSLATSTDKIQSNRAMAIADYLGVTLDYLLLGKSETYKDEEMMGAEDFTLLAKIHSLNSANYSLLVSMIDTMLDSQSQHR